MDRRILCFFALLPLLTGCGGEPEPVVDETPAGTPEGIEAADPVPVEDLAEGESAYIRLEELGPPQGMARITGMGVWAGELYITGPAAEGVGEGDYAAARIDPDTGEGPVTALAVPLEEGEYFAWDPMLDTDGYGGYLALAQIGVGDSYGADGTRITRYDGEGGLLESVYVAAPEGGADDLGWADRYGGCVVGPDDSLYLWNSAAVYRFVDGEPAGEAVPRDGSDIRAAVPRDDGLVLLTGGNALWALDWDLGWTDLGAPDGVWVTNLYSGPAGEILLGDGYGLYAFDPGTGAATQLLAWMDCGLTEVGTVAYLGADRVACLTYSGPDTPSAVHILGPDDGSDGRQVITLGLLDQSDELTRAVLAFNADSAEYRVKTVVYNDQLQLSAAIGAGDGPDVLHLGYLPVTDYVATGALVDLSPFVEAEGLDLVPEVVWAMEIDGGLYEVVPDFQIVTVAGLTEVVGTEKGWGTADVVALLEGRGDDVLAFAPYLDSEELLKWVCTFSLAAFIDWDTRTAHLDDPGFVELLDFCAEYASGDISLWEEDLLAAGRQLLRTTRISSVSGVTSERQLFGGDVTFIGFPAVEGSGSGFEAGSEIVLAMVAGADEEAAWAFMRTFWSDEYQAEITDYLPMASAHLAERLERELAENEALIAELEAGGEQYVGLRPNRADLDQLLDLIASADGFIRFQSALTEIVLEESKALFAGDKSAAETAAVVQNRVQTYLYE